MKMQDVLRKLELKSADDGLIIEVIRVFQNSYTQEICIMNPEKLGICGHYDTNTNKLNGIYKIAHNEGEMYSASGLYCIWVWPKDQISAHQAKQTLRELYKDKLAKVKKQAHDYKAVLKQIKKF